MPNPALATILFFVTAVLMIFVGAPLQQVHAQLGLIASEVVCILAPAAIAAVVLRRRPDPPPLSRIGTLGMPGVWLFWVAATSVLLGFAANALTGLMSEVVPGLAESAAAYEALFVKLMFPGAIELRVAAIVAVVVAAPLCEEALFRGVMLPLQRQSDRPLVATILLNGILFSALHMNPLSFVPLIVVGAYFAHLAAISTSLWPSVFAHATLNLANGVLAPALLGMPRESVDPTLGEYAAAVALMGPLVGLVWWRGAIALRARLEHENA